MHPINIDISQYITVVQNWITSIIGYMNTITITIGTYTFSLFDIFTYSAAFIVFVKIFVRRWVPNFDFDYTGASSQPPDVRIDGPSSLDWLDIEELINRF